MTAAAESGATAAHRNGWRIVSKGVKRRHRLRRNGIASAAETSRRGGGGMASGWRIMFVACIYCGIGALENK
jgi:hypothetical protein